MRFDERALAIPADDAVLIGVVAIPERPRRTGVLILVGGPQYRAGSHRQFVLLSRRLAAEGYPVLRFDFRGCGDSTGAPVDFDQAGRDTATAAAALRNAAPSVERIALWGLCDAASAALLAGRDLHDVAGYCLLNPWVRSEATLARTQLRHYYTRRILDRAFWRKLVTGQVGRAAARELAGKLRQVLRPGPPPDGATTAEAFQSRMASEWRRFGGPIQLILSGNDYTAKEFLEVARTDPAWQGLLERPNVHRVDLADADHTFSCARWRVQVENACVEWLARLDSAGTAVRFAG